MGWIGVGVGRMPDQKAGSPRLGSWRGRRRLDPHLFTDVMYVAKTIWAEARGEGREGMRLVAWVIRNRVEAPEYPRSYPAVVTQPGQFSVWLRSDPNRETMTDPLSGPVADDSAWYTALEVAWDVIHADPDENPIPAVLHYVDVRLENRLPAWAQGMEVLRFPQAPRLIFLRRKGSR